MDLNDQKIWLLGILFECPMGKYLGKCSVSSYLKLSVSEKLDLVDTLSPQQIQIFIDKHKKCLTARERMELT